MNDINELRNALFSTLRELQNKDTPMDLDRARAVNETSQTIINSLKVEVDCMKVTGAKGSGFIPFEVEAGQKTLTVNGQQTSIPIPGGRLVEHKMR